ncbi:MAG: AEC family transporter [Candidatus Merdivicinus sp.]|jgi:predicted permease
MGAVLLKAGIFLCIIAMGYGLKKTGFFRKEDFRVVAKIVLNITLPCAVISNFAGLEFDSTLVILALFGFLCDMVLLAAGYLVALRRPKEEQAFNVINYTGYNIGCFTLPYVQSFLGPAAVVSACIFDAGNAVICTSGSYAVGSSVLGKGEKTTVLRFLKKMFRSVPLDTYLIMLFLTAVGIALPAPLMQFAQTIGGANAFLAMLMIGIGFEINLDKSRVGRLVKLLVIRFAISGLLSAGFYFLLPFPLEVRQLMALIVFSPIASAAPAFTQQIEGDIELSSTANSLSIIISMTIMTVLLMGMGI